MFYVSAEKPIPPLYQRGFLPSVVTYRGTGQPERTLVAKLRGAVPVTISPEEKRTSHLGTEEQRTSHLGTEEQPTSHLRTEERRTSHLGTEEQRTSRLRTEEQRKSTYALKNNASPPTDRRTPTYGLNNT